MSEDSFGTYLTVREEAPMMVTFNDSAAEAAPDPKRSQVLRIVLPLQAPNEVGWPEADELNAMDAIEQAMDVVVVEALDARFVGRTAGLGQRELIYYFAPGKWVASIHRRLAALAPGYQLAVSQEPDPNWEVFGRVLFPSHLDLKMMGAEEVLDSLAQHGDEGESERDIRYWIYFPTESARAEAAKKCVMLGYTEFDENDVDPAEDDSGLPFGLSVRRDSPANFWTLRDAISELLEVAQELGGDYDGFESSVVPADSDDSDE